MATLALAPSVWAQRSRDAEEAVAGCAACSVLLGFPIFILLTIAVHIALLVWVGKDAKARGMDNAVVWMILVMATGLLGLVIYLLTRPKGMIVPCANCGNKRLQAMTRCPHCGSA